MNRFLVATTLTFFATPLNADDISVNEFVPGTIISSADMNENFQTLVQESNENDARIYDLENNLPSDTASPQSVTVWVDANGDIIGVPLGRHPYGGSGSYVFVQLPETDLVLSYSYYFHPSNGPQYFGGGVLSYSLPGCKGDAVLWTTAENSGAFIEFGVTLDGFYAYPGDTYPGEFYRQSYVKVESSTGEISCQNESRLISGSYANISSKSYLAPLAQPVLLQWR